MTTVNNLSQSTRADWSNKQAWSLLLQRAKPFIPFAKDGTIIGGTAAAARLLDPAKRLVGR